MRQIFGFWYALFLILILSVVGIARVNSGSVLILSFEGDAIHMAQIVLRMIDGQVPHKDFLTPLGAMAFLPIVWLVKAGFGLGAAFGLAPIVIGLIGLPMVFWVGFSRLSPSGALAFAVVIVVQLTAFLHGGTEPTVTASMYYNNWCWAVSSIVVTMCVLPNSKNEKAAAVIEPIILGLGVGLLVTVKVTFAVFLLPAIVIALIWRKQFKVLGYGLLVSVLFLTLVSLPFGGIAYWQGYVTDLRFVADSLVRAQPGDTLSLMILSPSHLVAIAGLVASFVLFRQAKLPGQALMVLALGCGWVLVTHQNWQNDPHWLMPAGLILFGLSKDIVLYNRYGWPIGSAVRVVGIMFIALGLPMILAQAQSLLIHNSLNANGFEAALVEPAHQNLRFKNVRDGQFAVEIQNAALTPVDRKPSLWKGEELLSCQKANGLIAELVETGRLLDEEPGLSGAQVFYADWINGLWLFSDVAPLKGGAPWYYGGAAGIENAEYLVIPLCPMGKGVRRIILETIQKDAELQFSELYRNEQYILAKRDE